MGKRHTVGRLGALGLAALLAFAGCSSNGDGNDAAKNDRDATATTVVEDVVDKPLTVVITNDDGIDAPGIDVLTNAISALDDVEVHVVAPAENQSVTGDKTTEGEVAYHDAETLSGVAGTAVDGFPADTIAVALDDLGLEPDLVASGINEGQNVGPVADVSGTVGAALTAARRGIPAVAGSAGLGDDADYEAAAELVVDWIVENRGDLVDGSRSAERVVNINVPACTVGSPRGVAEVQTASEIPDGVSPFTADCEVELDFDTPDDDVQAVANGFAAIAEIPIDADTDPAEADDDSADGDDPDAGTDQDHDGTADQDRP